MNKHQTKCDLSICIYNSKNKCVLDEIEISEIGSCDSCIIAEIPEEIQEYYKQHLRERLG